MVSARVCVCVVNYLHGACAYRQALECARAWVHVCKEKGDTHFLFILYNGTNTHAHVLLLKVIKMQVLN